MYTVKQLSTLARVSVRTLHYYDAIGLLKPTVRGENGYRAYDDEALLRLQQILFFKELDFSLEAIADILNQPGFDRLQALRTHKAALEARADHLIGLISTIEQTIDHLEGNADVAQQDLFNGFTPEREYQYEQEAAQRWGENARQSQQRWKRRSKPEQAAILAEGKTIYAEIVAAIDAGQDADEVQPLIERWHRHITHF